MATAENTVLLQSRDGQGNPVLFYPATVPSAVLGLEALVEEILEAHLGEVDRVLDEINGEVV